MAEERILELEYRDCFLDGGSNQEARVVFQDCQNPNNWYIVKIFAHDVPWITLKIWNCEREITYAQFKRKVVSFWRTDKPFHNLDLMKKAATHIEALLVCYDCVQANVGPHRERSEYVDFE